MISGGMGSAVSTRVMKPKGMLLNCRNSPTITSSELVSSALAFTAALAGLFR
jgi:hypothetical protein